MCNVKFSFFYCFFDYPMIKAIKDEIKNDSEYMIEM